MDSILQQPEWPASLASFVTWCLMWDPKARPTSTQALRHEYFQDAFDPLRPKSNSSSRLLGRKHSGLDKEGAEQQLASKGSSWFRRSLVARESAPAVPQHITHTQPLSPEPSPVHENKVQPAAHSAQPIVKARPNPQKRSTWTNGVPNNGAPIPILPSIKPVSPLSDAVTAQADQRPPARDENPAKKIGRQLSVASHGNHYAEIHRQEAERALNGQTGLASPPNGQKESFFSHLRKRARRFSGRHQAPMSPNAEDLEANAGCAPWASSNRTSMVIDAPAATNSATPVENTDLVGIDLDKALQSARYSLDGPSNAQASSSANKTPSKVASNPMLKRHHSLGSDARTERSGDKGPISSRTRRALQKSTQPHQRYETPDEEDELLDEMLNSAHKAAKSLDRAPAPNVTPSSTLSRPPMNQASTDPGHVGPYLTPSPSQNRNGISFNQNYITPTKPLDIATQRPKNEQPISQWPTPPYDESDWAAAASASIFAAAYR
jgi:meiosis induction protein kinase IME2/SME1